MTLVKLPNNNRRSQKLNVGDNNDLVITITDLGMNEHVEIEFISSSKLELQIETL